MVRRGLKTTVIATVMAMMLAPSFSAFARTGKSNTPGSWQAENNAWVFRNAEGQSVKGWVVYNQEWYYLNPENGQLKTGWLQLDGKWYFLSTESGAQQGRLLTGWQWIDGYCYYLMPTDDNNYGVLVVNGRTPDGYYVNQSGQWLHGENGDAVYEAGKGLPSAASSQQVAGASRALPGQVLGASRAIAAPGGGSFGGGGGGGSTGGGAGTATAGTSTGTATSGTSTGTATGGNTTEKPGETVTPGTSENTTQPGGTTEKPGTETGGNTEENPGAETGENAEEDKKEEEGLVWPANFTIDYNSDKKCFVLTFEKESNLDEINKFLQNDIKIFVTSPENKTTEYSLGNPKQNLMRAGNIFCHNLIGEDKNSYRFNALNISRAAFEPGDNKVQIQVEGYASKEYICQVSKQQLEDGIAGLKDFGKLETAINDDNRTGVYRVKLVSFQNLTEEQEQILSNLDMLYVDDVEYHNVKAVTNQDLCQIGPPSFMSGKDDNGFYFAIGNPPKEMGSHSITIQPKEYKDIKLSYVQKEEQLVKAPEVLGLKLNPSKKYYQLSFKGDDRVSKYSYLNGIKSFVVAGQTYTRMGSFHPELLSMGAKYILDDSTGANTFEDILLFSVPTANADKKQEIQIESEGYELKTIPLS